MLLILQVGRWTLSPLDSLESSKPAGTASAVLLRNLFVAWRRFEFSQPFQRLGTGVKKIGVALATLNHLAVSLGRTSATARQLPRWSLLLGAQASSPARVEIKSPLL
jgi:hypothetical protein